MTSTTQAPSDPTPVRRRRVVVVVAAFVVLALVVGGAVLVRRSMTPSWNVVWSDEFQGSSLDASAWTAESFSTYGDGNLELACLTDRPENLTVAHGALHLVARREAPPLSCRNDKRFPQGRSFSSAFISTQDKKSWQAVRIEVRASLPLPAGRSKGLWPAMWLRPDDLGPGEIDILEGIGTGQPGEAPSLQQTIHFDKDGKAAKKSFVVPADAGIDPTQVHTYAVTMYADRVDWSIDGEVTFSVGDDQVPGIASLLDRRWFLRVNLAVGGRWPGDPTATTELPADMTVLDVRVLAQG